MPRPLLDMLDPVAERIRALAIDAHTSEFAQVLLERRGELFAAFPGGSGGTVAQQVADRIAHKQLTLLRELPIMVEAMTTKITATQTHPAIRLMQVAALAYLVNPEDLLPDTLPAAYGFVDDAIVLRAAVATVPQIYDMAANHVGRELLAVEFHGICIPRDIALKIERSVRDSTTLMQMLGFLPPALIEDATDRLMNDPLVPLQPQPPAEIGWGLQDSWYRLREGVLSLSEDGNVYYRFSDGTGVGVVGGTLEALG